MGRWERSVITGVILMWSILLCVGSGLGESPDLSEVPQDFVIEKLSEGVFVADHHFPWPANSLVAEMEDGTLVLVDTPYTPAATLDLLRWMDKQFGKRRIVAINTHFHFDNLGGNAALMEAGVPIYGSDRTVELIKERGEEARELLLSWLQSPGSERYSDAFANIAYVPPTEIFPLEEGQILTFGEERVVIYYPGESHAPDNVVVYFPEKKILFGGCMVKSLEDSKLGNIADANVTAWPGALEKVAERFKEAEIVIPGHGPWGGLELLQHTLDLLTVNNETMVE